MVKQSNDSYLPLVIVVLLAIMMSAAIPLPENGWSAYMNRVMGMFLCLLAMFKLFNLSGFVDGFQMYDVVTKKIRLYGYAYPFFELLLGLALLGSWAPLTTNIVLLVLMSIGAIGVIQSLRRGLDLRCACLGTVLRVPLSTVTIVENVGMGIMAAINIFHALR